MRSAPTGQSLLQLMENASRRPPKPSPWGKIIASTFLLVIVGTLVWKRHSIVGFARNWNDFSDGSVEAKQLRNLPDVLDYIAVHRDHISLAAFEIGDEENGIFVNADTPRPLAGAVELQLLLGYSALVASGELDPEQSVSVADWERYWLPRTDGGAHDYSLQSLAARGAVKDGKVRLDDLAQLMARYNDDAAADYLLGKLGRARVDALPAQLGMPEEEPAWPMSGQLLSWQNTQLSAGVSELSERYRALDRKAYADVAWQLSAALETPARSQAEHERMQDEGLTLRLGEQAELTRITSPRGRARAYAALMAKVASGQLAGSDRARAALAWPLQKPELQEQFEAVSTKPGSLPGVLTSAYYARPKGHDRIRVLALFMEQLPTAVWLQLMQKFLHQRFELKLLGDDAYFEQVKQRLSQ